MIGFRVDANEIIATGHLMRCISIAEQVRKNGDDCVFFLAEDKCTDIIAERGFKYEVLNSEWDDLEAELEKFEKVINEYGIGWLVIDSYQITKKYCETLNTLTKVMVIDAPENELYKISAILNYSHLNDDAGIRELYKNTDTELLLGLKYAPLRDQFFPCKNEIKRKKQIFITTGGTDPFHAALLLVSSLLSDERFNDYRFCVVLGRMCNDETEISELSKERVEVLKGVSNMAKFMRESKAAFTAGGSTSIELLACHTPTVCFSFADNQIPFSKVLNNNNIIEYAGDIRDGQEKLITNICERLYYILNNNKYRNAISDNMASVCDGMGAKRIADYLVMKHNTQDIM